MEILATHVGGYPRIDDSPPGQALRRAIEAHQAGDVSDADLRKVEEEFIAGAIREQAEAGLDEVTDGLIRWVDPVSHVARALSGAEINGLVRLYDTNCYYRQPIFTAAPKRARPIVLDDYKFAAKQTAKPVRVVLTGPYTVARLSVTRGPSLRDLVAAVARALAEEVKDLVAAGAKSIQLDEPEILKDPGDVPILADALRTIAQAKGAAKVTLQTYFGDAEPLWDKLTALPADALGFDATYSPKLVDRLAKTETRAELILGVVDGRNTKLEDPVALARRLAPIAKSCRAARLWVAPSCNLEYLPRDRARAKLGVVAKLREALRSHVAR